MSDVKLYPPVQVEFCEGTRVHRGQETCCHDDAVALARAGDIVYPVCAFHTRSMTALPLQQVVEDGWLS